MRRSGDRAAGTRALHLLTAWATENRLVLGQRAVDGRANEITALPELIGLLDLTGAIVTVDALGCQKAVVEAIRDREADYVITVKGNQPTLHDDVCAFFTDNLGRDFAGVPHRYHRTTARGHGRAETRHYYIAAVPEPLRARHGWRDLRSLGMVFAERRAGDAEPTGEARFFITSLPPEVKRFARAVRGHWGIENGLNWTLDVQFGEDASRVHKDHGPENLALLRRIAVSLLQRDRTAKASVKVKRKMAGWDNDYLLQLVLGFSST